MRSEAQTPSSSRPSVGATVVPVAEPAVAETSIMEAHAETPGVEALIAPPSLPAPMETGGVGDGQSWAEWVEAGEEEAFQRSR